MKHLYIVRHGEAEEAAGSEDAQRSLTKKGRKQIRRLARWMRKRGVQVQAVATSPLDRAAQSASILQEKLGTPPPTVVPELAGHAPAKDLATALAPLFEGVDHLLVVGHQPQLGQLVSLLVTGGLYGRFDLAKGSLCHISCEEFLPGKCGSLDLLFNPSFSP